jgi:hypothetical protein
LVTHHSGGESQNDGEGGAASNLRCHFQRRATLKLYRRTDRLCEELLLL